MKKIAMIMHLCMGAASVVYGQQESAVTDSLWNISLQEVEVVSTRATRTTPVAFTNIGKEELQKQNLGQDLPYLLSMTPSAISTSDAGGALAIPPFGCEEPMAHESMSLPTGFLSTMPRVIRYFG